MTVAAVCPVCFHRVQWDSGSEYWTWSSYEQRYEREQPPARGPKVGAMRRGAHVRCPNPGGDVGPHFLPATYGDFDKPLIIGFVGMPGTGKTSLLAAMVHEMLGGALYPLDIEVAPLDLVAHLRFQSRCLKPFLAGRRVPRTEPGQCEYAECLLVTSPTGTRPIVFVDAAGGDLDGSRPLGQSVRFLGDADALVFVDSVEYGGGPFRAYGNEAFVLASSEIREARRFREVPATIVLTKADRVRFRRPVHRWFRSGQDLGMALDMTTFAAESEDVYAYLHSRGAAGSVVPFQRFSRCTMHFVSASGHDGFALLNEPSTVLDVAPSGVLRPLVALLAMTGVLSGKVAADIGL